MKKIVVLITCYNRKEKTLDCLTALYKNTLPSTYLLDSILVDDGSSDGTANAVREAFPFVQVVTGDSDLFWCRGMHKAFAIALHGNYDYYLWLNDDTMLLPDALSRLLDCQATQGQRKPVMIVGSTVDSETGEITYGGVVRTSKFRPMTFKLILPSQLPQLCDSMTGNIVLIPSEIAQAVGNLDSVFEHAMGDTDYALRVRRMGFDVFVGPGIFGTCSGNPNAGTYLDVSQPLSSRWRQIMGRKGLPWRSWLRLTHRHAGPLWPIYFAWPYIKLVIGAFFRKKNLRVG